MNITVYLGANKGIDSSFTMAVRELGEWIGENGNTLIYGGSRTGLMGEITELIVTKDMTERKTKMIELGDAFIAFPGGTGTLEEITEVMSKLSLNQLNAPCIFYNLNGYYDSMKKLLLHMVDMGLSTSERQKGIYFASDLEEIKDILDKFTI